MRREEELALLLEGVSAAPATDEGTAKRSEIKRGAGANTREGLFRDVFIATEIKAT